jgi:putative membrane protein
MIDVAIWPTVNALLNALSGSFLVTGFVFIRRGDRRRHKMAMLAACGASLVFLASYLLYHAEVGSTRFVGTGWSRPVYFSILLSHTVLAAAIIPLVIASLRHAFGDRVEKHRKIARWTFPMWLYVSVTGVLVYLFLYHFFAAG